MSPLWRRRIDTVKPLSERVNMETLWLNGFLNAPPGKPETVWNSPKTTVINESQWVLFSRLLLQIWCCPVFPGFSWCDLWPISKTLGSASLPSVFMDSLPCLIFPYPLTCLPTAGLCHFQYVLNIENRVTVLLNTFVILPCLRVHRNTRSSLLYSCFPLLHPSLLQSLSQFTWPLSPSALRRLTIVLTTLGTSCLPNLCHPMTPTAFPYTSLPWKIDPPLHLVQAYITPWLLYQREYNDHNFKGFLTISVSSKCKQGWVYPQDLPLYSQIRYCYIIIYLMGEWTQHKYLLNR